MSNKGAIHQIDRANDHNINFQLRRYYLFSEIDPDSAKAFVVAMDALSAASTERINITMNCSGGSVYDGLAMIDSLKLARGTTEITVTGQCFSMATAVLQAATYRRATANATFMVHDGHDGHTGHARNYEVWAAESKRLRRLYYDILAERSAHDHKYWERNCTVDKIFTAHEALNMGLIDEVLE